MVKQIPIDNLMTLASMFYSIDSLTSTLTPV
jgi:hypothetical protein